MSDAALMTVRVVSVGNYADAAWAEGRRFKLPADLPERLKWRVSASGDLSIERGALPAPPSAIVQMRERAAFTEQPPASARLPFSYQRVPGRLRAAIGSVVGRWNRGRADRWAAFPGWPLDLTADLLGDLARRRSPTAPRPRAGRADARHRLARGPAEPGRSLSAGRRSRRRTLDELHRPVRVGGGRGARAGHHQPRARRRRARLRSQQPHAVCERGERRRRLDAARPFATKYGAAGYRAPSLLRTRALLRDLAGRYRYDSSIPTSGGLFPVPNNGCASARPFAIEGILELPLSMPRDGSLRFLGYSPDEIAALWIDCADLIARSRGVVILLTHCERRFSGDERMFDAYRRFLEHVRTHPDRFVFERATDVVDRVAP